jgi:hypothetical protein
MECELRMSENPKEISREVNVSSAEIMLGKSHMEIDAVLRL